MGLDKQSKVVGEFSYEVTPLTTKLGNRVLLKLMKSVAPVMVAAFGGIQGLTAVSGALSGLSEDDFEWVVAQFAASTDVTLQDGRAPALKTIFDLHFACRYMEELEWLEFAVEVNYGPFFQGLKRKAEEAAKAKAAAKANAASGATPTPSSSTSQATSTGESNAS